MKTLVALLYLVLFFMANSFAQQQNAITSLPWRVVNDGVMGGLSQSSIAVNGDHMQFSGRVSLDNNGGFASVRTPLRPTSASDIVQLRIRGDGNTYQFRLRMSASYDGPAYVAKFMTQANSWQTVTLRAEDFNLQFRGRPISNGPQLSFARVEQVGFLIADKQQGDFSLDIAAIDFLTSI
ncbi:CIA30 family protein [Thalassotalea ponticola]|uniref:CIA30 family protein n=1 Tax=Thalassotalea ponticola TaxID=1523392 RepID=UPI0025B3DE20|nr:CIA30 family protein [Thalassotalea ponticola]MDN3652251.1 CIA30 family protein [Thalassotalea ponticola]